MPSSSSSSSSSTVGLLDLPPPLMLDHLLPLLSNAELRALSLVCRSVRLLTTDDMLWKRKTVADFKFPPHATARADGWQNLYRGLSDPEVYIWGEIANGRLGMQYEELPLHVRRDVGQAGGMPYPYQIPTTGGGLTRSKIPAGRKHHGSLVEIVAGGWSFHARTSTGKVWVWGTMNPETFTGIHGSHMSPNDVILTPELLEPLPSIRSLSSGRSHTVARTDSGSVLEWRTWGLVWKLDLHLKGEPLNSARINQLEAGWSFSAILTDQGDACIWYSDQTSETWSQSHHLDSQQQQSELVHRLDVPLLCLPPLPPAESSPLITESTEVITQLAAGEDFIVALSSHGALYRLDLHLPPLSAQDRPLVQRVRERRNTQEAEVAEPGFRAELHQLRMERHLTHHAQWQPLTAFATPQNLPEFKSEWLQSPLNQRTGSVGAISHISAHFQQFVVFLPILAPDKGDDEEATNDNTMVLFGSLSSFTPTLVPEIQGRGVIKVSMGDYHYGALTQQGDLYTWGNYSKGALGNWAPSDPDTGTTSSTSVANANDGSGGWSNLIPLPRIFGRGPATPRLGHPAHNIPALPGSRAAQFRRNASIPPPQTPPATRSRADVPHPSLIDISPTDSVSRNDEYTKLFAYDIAFAGWQSSALIMHIPRSA